MPDEKDLRRRTPAGGVRAGTGDEESSPVHIGRAVRDTQQAVHGAADRVEVLRSEVTQRIDQLDSKVDGLAESSAYVGGKLEVLIDAVHADREERRVIRVSAVQAEIEVEKTGEISKINEAAAVRASRRERQLKIIAAVGPVLTAALTFLLSRC